MFAPLLLALFAAAPPGTGTDARLVHGMTISCQTWGWEWGSDGFARELDTLHALGVNWVAIHPYARIRADGRVEARSLEGGAAPEWITRPIREAHERGMSILVIPHIAYWGSPWSWRGAIEFAREEERARFFASYGEFLLRVARAAQGADGFSIGNELDRLIVHEGEWRRIIAALREVTQAKLTYASNWSDYQHVPFWDALDAIGVEAYFPLSEAPDPDEAALEASWRERIAELRALHERVGKPVVFTELGYTISAEAASKPWADGHVRGAPAREAAEKLQQRCLGVALRVIEPERDWLRGAFLWKWFVGESRGESFRMQSETMRAVIGRAWGAR